MDRRTPPAIRPNATAADSRRGLLGTSGDIATSHDAARRTPASANPRPPQRVKAGARQADATSEAQKMTKGHGDVNAAGTMAETKSSAEKISQPDARSSAWTGGDAAQR